MDFGGSIGGQTSGEIGMGVKFKGFSNGGVSVNYPVDITLAYPQVDSFRQGQTVTIGSSMLVKPGAKINVANAAGDIQLDGTFAFSGGATAEACLFGCFGEVPIIPTINIPRQSGKIFSLADLVGVCGFVSTTTPDALNVIFPDDGCQITEQMAFLSGLPFTGKLGVPNITFNTTVESDGKTLRASGTHPDFIKLRVDLTAAMTAVTKVGLGVNVPDFGAGISASAEALTSDAVLRFTQSQEVRFTPTIEGKLELPASGPAVQWTVKTPQGAPVASGNGRTIVWDVGNQIEIVVPPGLNPGDVLNAAPTFTMKQTANFSNNVNTTFTTDVVTEALKAGLTTPRVEVVPEIEIIPEVCVPLLGCTDAVVTPAIVAPQIGVSIGPVWEDTQPVVTATDSTLFDNNRPAWMLGGFTGTTGTEIQLNPQYTPVVSASGPAVLNEAQTGTYAFAFSDADNDPLTYTIEWGDGATETGTGNPAGTSFNKNHAYADNGTYQVKLTVSDGHKIKGVATQDVTVNNVPPALSGITLTPTLNEDGTATISGVITDPGIRDSFTLEIDWGGPAGQAEGKDVIPLAAGTTNFTRTHQYKDDNPTNTPSDVFPVSVKVTDKDGGSDAKSTSTRVNNVAPTVFAGSDRTIDEGSFTGLGVEIFGKNLLQGADAESGIADWQNATGGFTTKRYSPAGSGVGSSFTLYQGQNGSGSSKTMAGDVNCLLDYNFDGTSTNMNDRVGSIRIPEGVTVTIYQHCGWWWNGWAPVTYGPGLWNFPAPDTSSFTATRTTTLVDNATHGYYNQALGRSLDGTQPQFPGGETPMVTFYENDNQQGGFKSFTGNSGCFANHTLSNGHGMNDNVRSLRVQNGVVTVYAHCRSDSMGRFPGLTRSFTHGNFNFADSDFVGDPNGASEIDFTPGLVDPDLGTAVAEPNLSYASAILGNWLSANPVLNSNWGGPMAIPTDWGIYKESAIIYPVDIPEGGSHLYGDFGVDNGIFVWVDGVYKFGAVQPGGAAAYEYPNIDLGTLPAGRHYIQVLREDDGGARGYAIRVRATVPAEGTLAVDSPGPSDRGGYYFGGATTTTASASQSIDLSSISSIVDTGGVTFQLSGWLGGVLVDPDNAKLTATFQNESGGAIGSADMGPVTAADRSNSTKLVDRVRTGAVPVGTRKIVLQLSLAYGASTINQAGADNLSFVLLPAPGSKSVAHFIDPGLQDTHLSWVNWGDGSPAETPDATGVPGNITLNKRHGYKDNGSFPITLTTTDDDTGNHSHSVKANVRNVPPTVNGVEQVYLLGRSESKLLATFTDPGAIDTHTASIDWGDGSSSSGNVSESLSNVAGVLTTGTVTGAHTYNIAGPYPRSVTAYVTVTDKDGGARTIPVAITVTDLEIPNPAMGAAPSSITEGSSSTFTGSFGSIVFPGGASKFTPTYDYILDFGDGSAAVAGSASPGMNIMQSHTYAEDGQYTATLKIRAFEGIRLATYTSVSQVITVNNAAPAVAAIPSKTANEGETVAFSTNFTDAGIQDTHTATINWGDGSTPESGAVSGGVSGSHTYQQDGTFTATVTVTDDDGGSATSAFTVTVGNGKPAVNAGADKTLDEGQPVSLSARFTDGGPLDLHTANINWGDGFTEAVTVNEADKSVAGNHLYANNGTYTATVCVRDDDATECDTVLITVKNVAPTVGALSNQSAQEGDAVAVTATFTDPGKNDTHTATINWGDGATAPATVNPQGATVYGTHTYLQNGTFTVTVAVADQDGGQGSRTFTVTVSNASPTVDAGPDLSVVEGATVTLPPATFADPGTADTHTATIDWGDGTTASGSVDQAHDAVSGSHLYADNGTYTVTVCVKDDGAPVCDIFTVTVANLSPAVEAGEDRTVAEGDTVTLTPAVSDPSPVDSVTTTIAWGDGTVTTGSTGAHAYADNGTYMVTVCAKDDEGAEACDTLTVTVTSVAPAVEAGADQMLNEGDTINLTATFTDPGTADTHTATILWGDGAKSVGTVSQGTVSGSHLYGDNGTYTLQVCVKDKDGEVGCDSLTVTVSNVAPGVEAGADRITYEGSTVALNPARFTDPGTNEHHTATVNWGDSTSAAGQVFELAGMVSATHVYAETGEYTVTVCVADKDGGSDCDEMKITVLNVAPTLDAGPDQTVNEGDTVNLAPATFNDKGTLDTHTARVDWGDGTAAESAVVTESPFGPPGSTDGATGTIDASHVYAESGTYTVTVTVTDDEGAATSSTFTVTVRNVAPTVSAGPDQTASEGETVNLAPATFNDKGTLDTHTATVDWGDGTGAQPATVTESPFGPPGSTAGANGTVDASHVYADNGTYTVTVTVTDDEGAATASTFKVTVNNAAPTVEAGSDQTANEGDTVNLAPATFNDMGTRDTHTATVDWGDGTGAQPATVTESPFGPPGSTAGANGTVAASHVYADNGTYTVTVTVTDDEGAATISTLQVTVNNVAPTVNAGPDQLANEGDTVNLAPATFNDMGTRDTHSATVDWGDGTGTQSAAVTESPFGPPGSTAGANGTVAANHVYADNGTYSVTVTVTDDEGAATTSTFTVTVGNVAPTVSAGPDQTANEGDTVSLFPATFNDKGTLDTHTATVDWGDGTGLQPAAVTESPFGPPGSTAGANGTVDASHIYTDNGTYTVTVTVTDDEGAATASTFMVTVYNVAPTVDAGPDGMVFSGMYRTVNASWTDPSIVDTHTAMVDWGDGSPIEAVPVTQGSGVGSLTAAHRYLAIGLYTATVCVTDDDGGQGCDTLQVEVKRLPVAINIKPGSDNNAVNVNSHPQVAVLTTGAGEYGLPDNFDATRINVSTARFGPAAVLETGAGGLDLHGGKIQNAHEPNDHQKDGDDDMVLQFDATMSGLTESTTSACVWGVTFDGVWFQGCDSVQIVPETAPPSQPPVAPPGNQPPPKDKPGKP